MLLAMFHKILLPIDEIHFSLFGVIERRSNSYYVAHVKRRKNYWECFDNVHPEKCESNFEDFVSIHMLFYIRNNLITDHC